MRTLTLTALLIALTACSSPPPLPSADDAPLRPVNTPEAVELQSCRNALHNGRIELRESREQVALQASRLVQWAQQGATAPLVPRGNTVVTVRFAFGAHEADLPASVLQGLIPAARQAPLIVLRGRTDGTRDSFAEARVARERANTIRDLLVAAGIEPTRIRTTYQPSGDHVADNGSAGGRDLNRRVEIELYRVAPEPVTAQALAAGAVIAP
ncbi:OmpA family protein [Aquincola tertiaricarbonis]|uniref:OmpA family protein n=1 Tax=Aquincola tertiaricarbonis TaxID=391953 RepID=A0ABY4S6W2_AQUTE|nr:OmpA family protein [Aquincola tertiaricarbonis]URI07632.1 OmpA family protein [Aquincola tertiaricarbonis]